MMHHPREAIIDGVKFILIKEELAERVFRVIKHYAELNTDFVAAIAWEDIKKDHPEFL